MSSKKRTQLFLTSVLILSLLLSPCAFQAPVSGESAGTGPGLLTTEVHAASFNKYDPDQVAKKVIAVVKRYYPYASVLDSYRNGNTIIVEVTRPQGDGAPGMEVSVNISTGVATCGYYGWIDFFDKVPRTFRVWSNGGTPAASSSTPSNCRFGYWNNDSFTSAKMAWNKVKGASGYQVVWSWTNGSHSRYYYTSSTSINLYNLPNNHVSQIKVRSFRWSGGKRRYSSWSNLAYITPSPINFTGGIVDPKSSRLQERLKWNIIYGCDGYNLFLTTNPYSTWRWNQSTSRKASSTSCVVKKYKGGNLKFYTNYYFKLVTRRRYNGVFCTVPMPSSSYYTGYFWFYKK